MVWTQPVTFVDGTVLTAAQMNTFLRDNLMETEVAKVRALRDYFVADGMNRISRRQATVGRVATAETTSQTSFDDLVTVGPTVTATTGSTALVGLYALTRTSIATSSCRMGVAVTDPTGATSHDANINEVLLHDGISANKGLARAMFTLVTNLTPGINTFTAKYMVSNESTVATFQNRHLLVLPF